MRKLLLVFDEERVDFSKAAKFKKEYFQGDTQAIIVLFDDDFYSYALSDDEKSEREKEKNENLDKLRKIFGEFEIAEDCIESWMGTEELIDLAKKKKVSEIVLVGGTKKMITLSKKLTDKNNIVVTFVPEY